MTLLKRPVSVPLPESLVNIIYGREPQKRVGYSIRIYEIDKL